KKKVILKVQVNCTKCRRKAMDVAAKHGADSVAVAGEQKDLLVVKGDDGAVDPADLAIELRKKLGHAKIVSVEEVAADPAARAVVENVGNKGEAQMDPDRCYCSYHHAPVRSPPSVIVVHGGYDSPPSCSIM
ncbi:hypothetical protein Taro_038433, partial [Colocasia esculenta]|nr:hypothetical protein [Colocasia esculenta]